MMRMFIKINYSHSNSDCLSLWDSTMGAEADPSPSNRQSPGNRNIYLLLQTTRYMLIKLKRLH